MPLSRKLKGGYLNSFDRARIQQALLSDLPSESPLSTPESPPPSPDSLRIMGLKKTFDSKGREHYYRISDGKEVPRTAFPSKPMQHYGPKAKQDLKRYKRNIDTFFITRDERGRKIKPHPRALEYHIKALIDGEENTPKKFTRSTVSRKLGTPTKTRSKRSDGDKRSSSSSSRSLIGSTRRKPKRPVKHTGQGSRRRRSNRKRKSKSKSKPKSK